MINGAHVIINSTNPDADRTFLREVLKLPHVDAGHGWLIFGLPPAEVAVHPSDENGEHQLYLMCDDIEALIREMRETGVECEKVSDLRWGLLTHLTLPGGGKLGIYEPRHARPKAMRPRTLATRRRQRPSKKPATKSKKRSSPKHQK